MSDTSEIERQESRKKGAVPVPSAILPHLDKCALLFDIDGTLIDLAPTPDGIYIPPDLAPHLQELWRLTSGALALVSGRTILDVDQIMKPVKLPAVGGHGAEMRLLAGGEVQAVQVRPLDPHLKKRFTAIGNFSSGILIEDKGYSLALHYRLAPHAEQHIFDSVAAIRADLPEAPIEVLNGKFVVEIKHEGFSKATAVRHLMQQPPFIGRRPIFLGDDITDETVFGIMPDIDGIAYSVGRKAQGVAGHFDAPQDVRDWLALMIKDQALRVR
ncbi:trehalose-phosphatase [Bradyrhizobium sp. LHD-71]|uniref:trehalose-phosphatase n=1 Tax=Bradyrhizobium sp. LHD-71 TaxID=3072141 RepID=UPI00280F5642|nr:trehalose-phosphatase [Bradyrhizobium sp. LHD-71]MDQ8727197.1 trehalose-phosphatase [Bradyrhizobium sp. LHD-71]